jgi:hypothetical protein
VTDYRLDGLSTRSFEHLIQALAVREVVNTTTIFGDGPDGGREATFNGATDYGAENARWNGYGVLQAKFRQRTSSPRADLTWLEGEIKKELKKYTRTRRPLPVPDYLIFTTNIVLTPPKDKGGKDRVRQLLDEFRSQTRLLDYSIWDFDQIRTYIDNHDSIRSAYGAWITPGDVLQELSRQLQSRRPDYHHLLSKFLQKELLGDQFARLEQAGHTADEAIPLAQVFIDLPIQLNLLPTREQRASSFAMDNFPDSLTSLSGAQGSGSANENKLKVLTPNHFTRPLRSDRRTWAGENHAGSVHLSDISGRTTFRCAILSDRS